MAERTSEKIRREKDLKHAQARAELRILKEALERLRDWPRLVRLEEIEEEDWEWVRVEEGQVREGIEVLERIERRRGKG